MTEPQSFYDAVGGEQTFRRIVARFYEQVPDDEILRPLYPEEDLTGAEDRLRMFLEQYWGGPRTYSDERGHPRLRMRHSPFGIDEYHRDLWLRHMRAALDGRDLPQDLDDQMWEYLVMAAHAMVNQPTEPVKGLLLDPPS